ncbi:MAG: ABC transporter permease subunit [Clostridiaceae bacterium]|nr:ABC transporter permease subunit [Clostridiaceae bacterium]
MSTALFKHSFKKNWLLLLIFFAVLTMYITIMIAMFDPDDMEAITSMLELFPADLMTAMGFSQFITDLTSYLASWLYGLLMQSMPMVYCIILGNRLVAKKVDNGSFASYLSTPVSRTRIIVTQGLYALISVIALFAAVFGVGVATSELLLPGLLDMDMFLQLNITTMLVSMSVMMICFFFSCLFNDSSLSTGFGAGLPIVFLLANMLGGTSKDLEVLKKFSLFGWYDPIELVRGDMDWTINLIYIALVIVLFIASVLIFRRRQLPI